MKQTLITTKIGDNPLILMVRRAELARQTSALVAEIALEQGHTPDDRPHRATPAGDEKRLRGIPVCGARGIGGAIKGSRPGDGID
jgi:hypothetical protein